MEMTELEKVIKEWEAVLSRDPLDAPWDLIDETLALLKEQEDLGTELGNAVELIHKKNERIEKLLKEQETSNLYKCPNCGTWVSAENVVRCKDCKYHAMDMCCNHPIEWNNGESRNHCNPNWFCSDGVAKDTTVLNK